MNQADQPTQTPVMDELAKALANLQTKRQKNQKLDDAYEWLESAAVDVLDLYKPEGK